MEAKRKKVIKKSYESQKVSDFGTIDRSMSKADQYWRKNGIEKFVSLNDKIKFQTFDVNALLIKKYSLRGIEFGNWVTIEDRWNYLNQLRLSLENLNKVLRFNNNVGLKGFLTIALGARGKGRALAHYEPWSDVINITRYKKGTPDNLKSILFSKTGGFGSYAHEYGHFLDYFFGKYIHQDKSSAALSGGVTTSAILDLDHKPGTLRYLMSKVLQAIIWKPGKYSGEENKQYNTVDFTDYYRKLRIVFAGDEYWLRRNEIFARFFEQYVKYKLGQKKINDFFLSKVKYMDDPYMSNAELLRVVKPMDALINKMAQLAKS